MNNDQIVPRFILAVQPTNEFDLENFFTEENFFYEKLKKPPYLRYTGWNLLTLDYPKIKNGTFWEVKNGERKTIRLYRDGALVSIGDASEAFLGWGSDREQFLEYPKLLALALIEYVLEFTRLYQEFLKQFPATQSLVVKFGFNNIEKWDGKRLILKPSRAMELSVEDWSYEGEERNAISKDFIKSIKIDITNNEYNSERVAFLILAEIFATFGISPEKIPYTRNNDVGQRVVNSEEIRNIR